MARESSAINKLDDVEAGFQMMRKGVPSAKKFAKYFPHTAQDLQDKKITQDQLAQDLADTYIELNVQSRGLYIDRLTCMELAKDAAYCVSPDKMFRFVQEKKEAYNKVWSSFRDAMLTSLIDKMVRVDPDNGVTIPILVKEAVDEVCERMANDFDKQLFRGKKGVFLKKCNIYNKDVRRYYDKAMPLCTYVGANEGLCFRVHIPCDDIYRIRKEEYSTLVRQVAMGLDQEKKICWNCDGNFDKLDECSKCQMAAYCCRECQVADWKKGHKQYCSDICSRKDHFNKLFKKEVEKELDPIRDELKNVHGFPLGTVLEHQIAFELFFAEYRFFPWRGTFEDEMEYPSLPIFYDNLCKVANGEWWFYESLNKEASVEEVDKKAQMNYLMDLCRLLWYKYDSKRSECIAIKIKEQHGLGEMTASTFVLLLKCNMGSLAVHELGRFVDSQKQGIRETLRKAYRMKDEIY